MTATAALGRGRDLLGRLVILALVVAPAWIEGAIHPR
jgi:hypothetical protein